MFERLRTLLGAKIVQLGVRIAGFDAGKLEQQAAEEDDEDDDLIGDATCPPVVLNEHARAMVQEGMTAKPPTRLPSREPVLAGSARDRFQRARKELERRG